jgi:A/G-specific adenine glycosylase
MNQELILWSKKNHSQLPWRKRRTLYKTLVSEIMLQQTTVATVVRHFGPFLDKYPDIYSLAQSTEEEICIAWKGLGYYRRARNLRKAAINIVTHFDGKIPLNLNQLKTISGIGEYTAQAILGIGGNKRALALDANLERVLSRLFCLKEEKGLKLQKRLRSLFEDNKILKNAEVLGYRDLNESLMDLGRVCCQAKRVNCSLCPLSKDCLAREEGRPLDFPVNLKSTKSKDLFELKLLRVVVRKRKKILVYKKEENYWLAGQKELPTFIINTNDDSLKQYPWLANDKQVVLKNLKKFKTSITKYNITNYIYEMTLSDWKNFSTNMNFSFSFVSDDTEVENLSTATIKALKII